MENGCQLFRYGKIQKLLSCGGWSLITRQATITNNLLSVTFSPQQGWHTQPQTGTAKTPYHTGVGLIHTITWYQTAVGTSTDNSSAIKLYVRATPRVMNKWSRKCFGTDLIFSWGCARRCVCAGLQPPTAASAKQCYIKSPCWT